mgnify:CR=1 FL=1
MDLQELFSSPPSAYRGKPFWAWNGLLEEEVEGLETRELAEVVAKAMMSFMRMMPQFSLPDL